MTNGEGGSPPSSVRGCVEYDKHPPRRAGIHHEELMKNTFHLDNPAWKPGTKPRVGLFVPCYIDQLYPRIAFATVHILNQCGVEVDFPPAQTCCGQPMANTGCTEEARPLAVKFMEIFKPYDYVVGPSASCVAMVRMHYDEYLE